MTLFIEFCGPWRWRPGMFESSLMFRVWWGCVAIGVIFGDLADFHDRAASGQSEWGDKS